MNTVTKPSLNEVNHRIDWAADNINLLKRSQCSIERPRPDELLLDGLPEYKEDSEGNIEIITPWLSVKEVYDPSWARLLSYAVSDLRSALEYLVYSLAWLDSGVEQKGTQFPICTRLEDFKKCVKQGYLRGVNSTHVAKIEAAQPFNGGCWLKDLSGLSNPDKHMHLTLVTTRNRIEDFEGSLGLDPETGTQQVNLEMVFTRLIADSLPVIPLLEELHEKVRDTVGDFRSDF